MRIATPALAAAALAMAMTATAHSQDQANNPAQASASGSAYTPADEAAGHAGDIGAIRRTMQHYLDAKDARTAAVWARLGADKDDTACQIALARLLSGDELGKPDLVHAFMWDDIAVAKHDPDLGADAENLRDDLRHRMDVDQVLDAKAAESKWRAAHHH
jgi:hypothetical protein